MNGIILFFNNIYYLEINSIKNIKSIFSLKKALVKKIFLFQLD
jgi:hypothetical protein